MEKLMYRVSEAAAVLGIGKTALYAEMAAGRLRYVRRGKTRLVPAQALTEYVELLTAESIAS